MERGLEGVKMGHSSDTGRRENRKSNASGVMVQDEGLAGLIILIVNNQSTPLDYWSILLRNADSLVSSIRSS